MAAYRLFPVCLLLLAACRPKAPERAAYVNSAVCATCHREIAETYRRTGMGRSFARAGAEPFADARFFHTASDRHYAVYRKDGKLFQRRHQLNAAGAEINVVEKEMHYVIGSGNHSRTYLSRKPDGRLAELPLSWYSEGKGLWAMSPGYDRPDQEDFRRDINYQCMFCHNGYPDVAAGADGSGTAPIVPAVLPEGIDCQRCHGPGGAHVAAMQAGKKDQTAIVNPAKLTPERQLDLCMQCHLETTSFRLPGAIVRYDRPLFSYRPGEPLGDYALHFDHAPGSGREDKFEIAHAAYRLRQSACFLKSGGKMVCTTCHNPHDTAGTKPACLGCHPDAKRHDTPQGCVACHMPKRRTEDVVHVVMTDHFIQRRKPARDLLAPMPERGETEATAYKGEVVLYYPSTSRDSELYLAVAQVRQGANLKAGIPRLEAAIQKQQPREAEFYFELAEAHRQAGSVDQAIVRYEEALRRKPSFAPAIRGLAAALGRAGRLPEAAETLRKALAAAPEDAALLNDLGLVLIGLRSHREAVELLEKAVRLDPDLAEAHNNLGGALLEQGNRPAAEQAYRTAIRTQPDFTEAHRNLANLLAGSDFAQAEYHYRKAAAYFDHGMALAGREKFAVARQMFEAAVRAHPGHAEAHNALGEMYTIEGQGKRAVASFERAVALKPEYAMARLNLGTSLVHLNRAAEARPHLERAAQSQDAEISRAAVEALQSLSRR